MKRRKTRRLIRICAIFQDKRPFGNGRYEQALIHFALIGDKSSKVAYKEVIPTSSQILSKLDLEILILVLSTRFVHITSRTLLNCT